MYTFYRDLTFNTLETKMLRGAYALHSTDDETLPIFHLARTDNLSSKVAEYRIVTPEFCLPLSSLYPPAMLLFCLFATVTTLAVDN